MEKQNVFLIGGRCISVKDLRNKEIMKAFEDLYTAYLGLQSINLERFRESSFRFFDICETEKENYGLHDNFFTNFTYLWENYMNSGNINKAKKLWDSVLGLAYDWEKKNDNKRIHKGTPYYFYGVTSIIAGNISGGFLLMHQAFREDQETEKKDFPDPETPAYSFITLDYAKINQYFLPKVIEIAKFLNEKIKTYVKSRKGNLNLKDFKQKFLENKEDKLIIDIVYYFIYSLFQLHELFNIREEVTKNNFASMLEASTIFDLCLVLDNILKIKDEEKKHKHLSEHIDYLSKKSNLRYKNYINIPNNEIYDNSEKFTPVLKELLESKYKKSKLNDIEKDFAISLICRNYGAHQLRNNPLIYVNFKDIVQRILNSIFYSVEKLY